MNQELDWTEIARQLAAPFDPAQLDWRPLGKGGAHARAELAAYIDARAIQDRLDTVVGVGGWSFDWTPVAVEGGEVKAAKGVLTIYGVSKADVGTASAWEASKGAISDSLKRAGVMWGIGRYLYDLGKPWVTLDEHGRVSDATLIEIRRKLAARAA